MVKLAACDSRHTKDFIPIHTLTAQEQSKILDFTEMFEVLLLFKNYCGILSVPLCLQLLQLY